jgi:small subunit ribosomal protein S12
MPTIQQLCKKNYRINKKLKSKTPALEHNPQKKGICIKIFIRTPKKPNSAERKVVKFKLTTGRIVEAYICGEGHKLHEYSQALMRGGRVQDLPGVKYHLIRGKYDFEGLQARKTSRSKYGTKKTSN